MFPEETRRGRSGRPPPADLSVAAVATNRSPGTRPSRGLSGSMHRYERFRGADTAT